QIDQRRARQLLVQPGLGEQVRHDAGQRQARGHVVVNAKHVVPQADIDVNLGTDRRPHRPAGLRTESHGPPPTRATRMIPRPANIGTTLRLFNEATPRARRGAARYSLRRWEAGLVPSAHQVPAKPSSSVASTATAVAKSGPGRNAHWLPIGPVTRR